MRTALLIAALLVGGGTLALWAVGGFESIAFWAAERQRGVQNAMAQGLRALKGGEPGALAALMGLCFAYGFFHAAGPGHGKVLIGGYGVGSRVRLVPLLGIAVVSSLAQATTAVALVYGGVFLLDWTRERIVGVTEDWLVPASYAAVGLIGLWLVWRGARRMWRLAPLVRPAPVAAAAQGGGHHHHHRPSGGHCDTCGHAHGPSVEQVAGLRTLRDGVALVASVAIRPCTGALFLLVLTWRMGIDAAGIAGAYVMGLGTASVTVAVAVGAVIFRDGVTLSFADRPWARALVPALELAAGALVALVAANLLLRSL